MSGELRQNYDRGLVDRKLVESTPAPNHFIADRPKAAPPNNFIAGRPKAALLFRFFGDLDVARCYLWLFSLHINIKIGKISC